VINLDYTPKITAYSLTATGLTLTVARPAGITKVYKKEDFKITFGKVLCVVNNDPVQTENNFAIECDLPSAGSFLIVAGDLLPIVHV